jgi:WD40 repeat protein
VDHSPDVKVRKMQQTFIEVHCVGDRFPQMALTGEIRSVVFDNEANQIACATSYGFAIFDAGHSQIICNCKLVSIPAFAQGARLISTLGNSNIVAVTPNSPGPQVFIFDRNKTQELASVQFGDPVCGIRLRPDILVAATCKKISVRSLSDFSEIASFEPAYNRDGIFDIPATFSSSLVAFPSPDIGVASVADYLDTSVRMLHVHAFKTPIVFVKFSDNGRLLAVAGDEGKNIAVYSVPSMKQVAFLRRGVTGSKLLSISFEPHGTQLAVTSVSGHMHVFFIAWTDAAPADADGRGTARPQIKLKDSESHPAWVCFSAKTLRLGGVTTSGQPFKVQFDEQMKQASLELEPHALPFKPA